MAQSPGAIGTPGTTSANLGEQAESSGLSPEGMGPPLCPLPLPLQFWAPGLILYMPSPPPSLLTPSSGCCHHPILRCTSFFRPSCGSAHWGLGGRAHCLVPSAEHLVSPGHMFLAWLTGGHVPHGRLVQARSHGQLTVSGGGGVHGSSGAAGTSPSTRSFWLLLEQLFFR